MGRWLALDLILITRRYTEDDPLDSEDGCVLVCMEKYTVTPPPCLVSLCTQWEIIGFGTVTNFGSNFLCLSTLRDPPRTLQGPSLT